MNNSQLCRFPCLYLNPLLSGRQDSPATMNTPMAATKNGVVRAAPWRACDAGFRSALCGRGRAPNPNSRAALYPLLRERGSEPSPAGDLPLVRWLGIRSFFLLAVMNRLLRSAPAPFPRFFAGALPPLRHRASLKIWAPSTVYCTTQPPTPYKWRGEGRAPGQSECQEFLAEVTIRQPAAARWGSPKPWP